MRAVIPCFLVFHGARIELLRILLELRSPDMNIENNQKGQRYEPEKASDMNQTIPELQEQMIPELQEQMIGLLTRVKLEQLLRLDNGPDALRCLQDALMKVRDVLKLSSPSAGVAVKTATNWFVCHPDSPHDQFSQIRQEPVKSFDELLPVYRYPRNNVIVGFTDDHEKIVEGYITEEGYIEWTCVAEKERREAADYLLGTFTYPEGLSYVPMTRDYILSGLGHYKWYFDDNECFDKNEWLQDVLVLEGKGKSPIEMSVLLQFAEFSNEIISAKLDGRDIMPKSEQGDVDAPGDVEVPGRDNNSPNEDRGPEPC